MNTHADFEELLRLLEERKVDYLIIGGYAVAFHGYPRFTSDIDIFYSDSEDNIARLRQALIDFAFDEPEVPPDLFRVPGNIVSLGAPPARVDFLNRISAVDFDTACLAAVRGSYGRVSVKFISLKDLLLNKSGTSRAKDKADVEELLALTDSSLPK